MRSDLPPEAFSKEMLGEAFNWLQSQPESVRQLIQTPEQLVSLYRKHQHRAAESDAPVSSKQFISDLKTLAKGLEKFSDDQPAREVQRKTTEPLESVLKQPEPPFVEAKPQRRPSAPSAPQVSLDFALDERTQAILKETKLRFNLSSEVEALRLLTALGYEKISKI